MTRRDREVFEKLPNEFCHTDVVKICGITGAEASKAVHRWLADGLITQARLGPVGKKGGRPRKYYRKRSELVKVVKQSVQKLLAGKLVPLPKEFLSTMGINKEAPYISVSLHEDIPGVLFIRKVSDEDLISDGDLGGDLSTADLIGLIEEFKANSKSGIRYSDVKRYLKWGLFNSSLLSFAAFAGKEDGNAFFRQLSSIISVIEALGWEISDTKA